MDVFITIGLIVAMTLLWLWINDYKARYGFDTGPALLSDKVITTPEQEQRPVNWFIEAMHMDTHIMLVGKTKAGKSMLAMALLIARSYIGQVVILDPHAKAHDWSGLEVVGKGRNYKIVERHMHALLDELQKRYDSPEYDSGEDLEPLTIILDELPLLIRNIPVALEFMQVLAMEGRKVNMRLILLTQSNLVKSLKLEGQGDTRDNFITYYLGKHARRIMPELKDVAWPAVIDNDGDFVGIDRSFIPGIVQSGFSYAGRFYKIARTGSVWNAPDDYQVPESNLVPSSKFPTIDRLRSKIKDNPELELKIMKLLHDEGYSVTTIVDIFGGNRQERFKQVNALLKKDEVLQ